MLIGRGAFILQQRGVMRGAPQHRENGRSRMAVALEAFCLITLRW